MKRINLSTLTAVAVMLMLVGLVQAQGVNGLLGTTETALTQQGMTFKNILGIIFLFIGGGAIVYAAYTAFYDQQQMRRAMIGLIVGFLIGTIGAAMSLIN